MARILSLVAAALLATIVAVAGKSCEVIGNVPNPSPAADVPAPEKFTLSLETNVVLNGKAAAPIVIEVNRSWAPKGADRLYSLMLDGFYNQAAFFRVVPNFVLQFGISAIPDETKKWDTIITDDPVVISNTNWTVSYATAGPDTRTTQLFINYVDNSRLDASGFAPFGKVVSGFETALGVVNPTPGDSDGINQEEYTLMGNKWLLEKYPQTSLITCGRLQ